MLNGSPFPRSRPRAPVPDSAEAGAAHPPSAAILDPQALQRLRDLDPNGASKLMERVVAAFNASVARLIPQLHSAQAAGDSGGIRLVAHTLKSSSSSVGAARLSQMCADIEAMARQGQAAGLQGAFATLSTEVAAVLDALEHALDGHR
jgi:HPt (histidine-containing phosphotransfer) domain-containing protein